MKPSIPGRVAAHGLAEPRFDTAAEVVRHLGGVQSQLPDMALWSIARRSRGLTLADLREAYDRGDVRRTHVLRPTWHFVDPADVGWLLALTGPRIRRLIATNTTIGATLDELERVAEVIVELLADGVARRRADLAAEVAAAGFELPAQALGHALMVAEIEGLVANGPMQGKQHTYQRTDLPPVDEPRDELLARVARRYARGHGPVRDRDLAWWTSLTLTDSRRAIELGELRPLEVDGQTHWYVDEPVEVRPPRVMLLSNFDEYISYVRDPSDFEGFAGSPDHLLRGSGLLLLDGRLSGTWTRRVGPAYVEIVVDRSPALTAADRRALDREAEAYGRFVDREARLVIAA